ncbi:unnamed protein product [Peniophora sp. CBMAI 1063]|nr:unnamed protein product [Peniophora sp. CBMAI 1063]
MTGQKGILNSGQTRAVQTILKEEFEPYIRTHDKDFSGYATVSGWAGERKKRIFSELSVFKTQEVQGDLKRYRQAVDSRFRNCYHAMKQRANPFREAVLKLFTPRTTAFDLYECDVGKEIAESMDEVNPEVYQGVLQKRWLDEDEEVRARYEKSVGVVASNVEHNRKLLLANLKSALHTLCQEGALGGMMASVVLAYRDVSDGQVRSEVCDGRAADENPRFGAKGAEESALSALDTALCEYADQYLPRPSRRSSSIASQDRIPSNPSGIPVFPSINMRGMVLQEITETVILYCEVLWSMLSNLSMSLSGELMPLIEYSRSPYHPCELPWDDVNLRGSDYYDVNRYSYMCFDQKALEDPATIVALASSLQEHCGIDSPDPFTFKCSVRPAPAPTAAVAPAPAPAAPTSAPRASTIAPEPVYDFALDPDLASITSDQDPTTIYGSSHSNQQVGDRVHDQPASARSSSITNQVGSPERLGQLVEATAHASQQLQDVGSSPPPEPNKAARSRQKRQRVVEPDRPERTGSSSERTMYGL